MKPSHLLAFAAGAALVALLVLTLAAAPAAPAPAPALAAAQDADAAPPPAGDKWPSPEEMARIWKQYSEPGPEHDLLERFLGTWKTSMTMMGAPPLEGSTTYRWLIPDYFLIGEGSAPFPMLGRDMTTVDILGYDKFKQSYVSAMMDTMDTNLLTAEGDLTPAGDTLILYGTLDEYLTGEHDKMVKYVWRFRSDDEMVLEVHDLPIGETNTKVVEVVFTRD